MLSPMPVAPCLLLLLLAGSATAQSRPSRLAEQPASRALMTLIDSELLASEVEELVIKALPLTKSASPRVRGALSVRDATSYRVLVTRGGARVVRLFVAVRVSNTGGQPWTAHGVTVSAGGEELKGARLSKAEPIALDETGLLLVEVVATEARARTPLTLTLWDESGERTVTLGPVSFP
jgi:hypothetical protein